MMSGLTEPGHVVICAEDFPLDYFNGQHPDDYKITDKPVDPKCIFHHIRGKLWWRASWKLSNGKFMTMSFLLDTGAPKHLYLCNQALNILEQDGQLAEDFDMDLLWLNLFGRKCRVEPMPDANAPANIIGLKLLKRFGLELREEDPHFTFNAGIAYLDSA